MLRLHRRAAGAVERALERPDLARRRLGTLADHEARSVVVDIDADELVKPKAYIVLNQGYEPSETLANDLKAFVKNKLAPFKYPRWIEFVTELPKTATGKIQRFKLRGN